MAQPAAAPIASNSRARQGIIAHSRQIAKRHWAFVSADEAFLADYGRAVALGEERADIYIGLAYNRWQTGPDDYSPPGTARATFMANRMPLFVDLAANP